MFLRVLVLTRLAKSCYGTTHASDFICLVKVVSCLRVGAYRFLKFGMEYGVFQLGNELKKKLVAIEKCCYYMAV